MKRRTVPLDMKFYSFIPVSGLLIVISMFLPVVSIKEEGISASAVKVFMNAINSASSFKDGRMLGVLVLLTGLSALFSLFASVLTLFIRKRAAVILSIFTFLFSTLSALVILFTIAGAINASGLLQIKFLIKYLGIGYWAFLLLGLFGMVTSMLTARISPHYISLVVLSIIWLIPLAWIIMISFRAEIGSYTSSFFPKQFTLNNYVVLLTDSSKFPYVRWFTNTLFVATASCLLTSFIVLSTAYTLSRLRFAGRRLFMNILLVLGMFPGFMSMIAVYYILKGLGMGQSLISLVLVYSGGASMTYYIAKGFFDTIPKAMDEAAYIDGASKWYVFTRITIPLSKSIIVFTLLTAFMAPWADYIFASIIMRDNYQNYTLAVGLYLMLTPQNIPTWYTRFAAGAVLVSIPIAILFISFQKYYSASIAGSVKG